MSNSTPNKLTLNKQTLKNLTGGDSLTALFPPRMNVFPGKLGQAGGQLHETAQLKTLGQQNLSFFIGSCNGCKSGVSCAAACTITA